MIHQEYNIGHCMFLEISPLNRHTKIQTFIALFQSFYPSSRSSVWLDQANVIFIDGFPTFSWHLELVVNFSMFARITRECIRATARLSNHSNIFGFIYCDIDFMCISFFLLKPRFSTRICGIVNESPIAGVQAQNFSI